MFGKSIKPNIQVDHREITTIVVSPRTSISSFMTKMQKENYISRRKMRRASKFKVCINENNEATYWDVICRKPY